jgi:hypothetical protein
VKQTRASTLELWGIVGGIDALGRTDRRDGRSGMAIGSSHPFASALIMLLKKPRRVTTAMDAVPGSCWHPNSKALFQIGNKHKAQII